MVGEWVAEFWALPNYQGMEFLMMLVVGDEANMPWRREKLG
jgi:hypothetical protein